MISNYKILKTFNSGNQAETFLAEEVLNKRQVVIKKISVSKVKNWKTVELFERECGVLKNLSHHSIPSYLDSFHDENSQADTQNLYLVQEYIDGLNLQEVINSGKRFNIQEIYEIIKQLLEIQVYLHGLNPALVHRDIKPANLIYTKVDDKIKINLIDFGTVNKSIVGNTGGSTVVGTIGYMASEQFMGKSSQLSDLYSTGAVLLFLLTAIEPSELPIIDMQLQFRDNNVIRNMNNEDLNYFIEKLVNSSESKRYKTANLALKDLSSLINGQKIVKGLNSDLLENKSSNDLYKNEEINKGRKLKVWESALFISSLLIGIVLASYIYLINFNRYSESQLVIVTPFWVLPTAFGVFGLTTEKENKLTTAIIRSAIVTALLIFFIHFVFPSL